MVIFVIESTYHLLHSVTEKKTVLHLISFLVLFQPVVIVNEYFYVFVFYIIYLIISCLIPLNCKLHEQRNLASIISNFIPMVLRSRSSKNIC